MTVPHCVLRILYFKRPVVPWGRGSRSRYEVRSKRYVLAGTHQSVVESQGLSPQRLDPINHLLGSASHTQVDGDLKLAVQLGQRPKRHLQVARHFSRPSPSRALGSVRSDRDRRPSNLRAQSESLGPRVLLTDSVPQAHKFNGFLIDLKLSEIVHRSVSTAISNRLLDPFAVRRTQYAVRTERFGRQRGEWGGK